MAPLARDGVSPPQAIPHPWGLSFTLNFFRGVFLNPPHFGKPSCYLAGPGEDTNFMPCFNTKI